MHCHCDYTLLEGRTLRGRVRRSSCAASSSSTGPTGWAARAWAASCRAARCGRFEAKKIGEKKSPPRSTKLREAIGQASDSLTPRARAAAQYALEHPNDIALQTGGRRPAQASGIAASAFIRMAQSLGFSGYGELQRLFLAPLQRAAAPSFRERIRHFGGELAIEDPSDPTEVLRAFSQANMVSLEHLRDDAASLSPRPRGSA